VAERILVVIKEAQDQGAKLITGGSRNGATLEPTVLTQVKPEMTVVAKEQFGPVLSFITVDSYDAAVDIVNRSNYGLQACIFSKDEGSAMVLGNNINVGTIQINGSPQRGPDHFPFLGIKRSGVGVQGVRYSLEAMSRLKPVVINKPQ
jgi:glyceraldehyde-3-phosphate dehydrogenase (NADP+)